MELNDAWIGLLSTPVDLRDQYFRIGNPSFCCLDSFEVDLSGAQLGGFDRWLEPFAAMNDPDRIED
jgi:hypothetical protein